jgi:protein-S-isoprenylcysteine O-methyltransferase Ste14
MSKLENRVPPPFLLLIVGAAMYGASFLTMKVAIDDTLRWIVCGVILSVAGLFGPTAFRTFGKANTTIDPVHIDRASSLVTVGIYQYTRNPMYVSLTLILCAWSIWLSSPVLLVGPAFFAIFINRFQIVPEERFLLQKFGNEYVEYRRQVRRWI